MKEKTYGIKKDGRVNKNQKYIFVTGGVLSGIGKGITAASLGALLNCAGFKVSAQKMDQYLNVDPGTMNPKEHGEVFVTADGVETDLDLGHYERFIGTTLNKNSITISGGLFQELIERERAGKYLGKTVQVVPHLTSLIQEKILAGAGDSDIHIVEIGGTVGDIEGLSYIEAVREFQNRVGRQNCLFIHVAYVPFLEVSQEFKTKPLQNSVRDLRSFGLVPDIIVPRVERVPKNNYIEKKVAMFCDVVESAVVVLPNADTIYRVPTTLFEKKVHEIIFKKFNKKVDFKKLEKNVKEKWGTILKLATKENKDLVKIGIVAKYLDNTDTYYCVIESLKIAAWHAGVQLKYEWVSAEELETKNEKQFSEEMNKYDGILVTGGFGVRGVEGKIRAAAWCLKNKKPYMGICLGLQVAVIAAARSGGLKSANSEEFVDEKKNKSWKENVVYIMKDQIGKVGTGGTMRLGTYECFVKKDSLAEKTFKPKEKSGKIDERHRHRFEVNRAFETEINRGGVVVSGTSKDEKLVELVEADPKLNHPFYLATQSHPEFLSRPWAPHPMFLGLIKASKKEK